jgi:hypothetical protein
VKEFNNMWRERICGVKEFYNMWRERFWRERILQNVA